MEMSYLNGMPVHPDTGMAIIYGIPFELEWELNNLKALAKAVLPEGRYARAIAKLEADAAANDEYDLYYLFSPLMSYGHRFGANMYTAYDNFHTWVLGVEVSYTPGDFSEEWVRDFQAWPRKVDHPYGPEIAKLFKVNPIVVEVIANHMIGDIGYYSLPIGYNPKMYKFE